MTDGPNVEQLDLSDAELLQVLKNHGIDRRNLMKVLGAGAGLAALGGSATATSTPGNRIDDVYGAPYAANRDNVPSGLVDHEVLLHIHDPPGAHPGFPDKNTPETFFDPVGLHVKPGEVVQFQGHGVGLHTVTSFHPKFNEPPFILLPDRVPTDHGFTSSLVTEGDSWLYRFTTKGVYDLLCLPHVSLGMVIRIVVFDPSEDDIEDPTFDEPEPDPNAPLFPNAAAVLNDTALDPSAIVGAGEVAWSDLTLP